MEFFDSSICEVSALTDTSQKIIYPHNKAVAWTDTGYSQVILQRDTAFELSGTGFNLVTSLTAVENVELPLVYRGMKKEERNKLAIEALDRVGLSHRLEHLPKQMSGGQQQRVAIARAVAARPPIILADEPTGNLDSHSGIEVMKILHELHREGRTVILITHDNDIAKEAQRVIRIQDGQIVSDIVNTK